MAAQEGDWRAGRSSAEQLIHMLDTGALSDCTFRVGHLDTPQEFQLHRLILSKASAVWERMLLPGAPHMREADTGSVHITDISPRTFLHVLRQVYGDEAALTTLSYPEVQDVLQVADRYQVPALVSACEARICQGELITPDTVWSALSLLDSLHGLDRTRGECVKVLCSRTEECLDSPGFLTSCESAVELLLSQEALSLGSEFTLVCAVSRWARERTQEPRSEQGPGSGTLPSPALTTTRQVLAPRLLPLLRLASLNSEQLDTVTSMAECLTRQEVRALREGDLAKLPPTLSREKPREVMQTLDPTPPKGPLRTLTRSVLSEEAIQRYRDTVCCRIQVSSKIWLCGFTIPSQTKPTGGQVSQGSSRYKEDLGIICYHVKKNCPADKYADEHLNKFTVGCEGQIPYDSKIYINFPYPVLMDSCTELVMEIDLKHGGDYKINKLSMQEHQDGVELRFSWEEREGIILAIFRRLVRCMCLVESVTYMPCGAAV